ncbi:hypothetical protein [uncultured Kordia sp.]|uniref:hypothetical protein n=1 Tax=uncultured Kordia sp. TaxID=507699 RepID=UPI0026289857|nr:hypothetical protein [uncultured Kordia sp.]
MKKRLHVLKLNKTKIVKLSSIKNIQGGTDLESDPNNPRATCDVITTDPTSDMTDDKTNTDNYIPSKSCVYYC